jgi:hypothetical protein
MQNNGQVVSADLLVTMIGEQAVELRVLRAENGALKQMVERMKAEKKGIPDEGAEEITN